MVIQPYTQGGSSVLVPPKRYLGDNSWNTIDRVARSGKAKDLWAVGDRIDVKLTGDYAQTITLQILDFDHDDLVSGGKAGITFDTYYLLNNEERLHSTSSYSTYIDYDATEMHTKTLPKILECFPGDLRSAIKTVNKPISSRVDDQFELKNIPCELFLLSEYEIHGRVSISPMQEGNQYAKYENPTYTSDYAKRLRESPWSREQYWLRSPEASASNRYDTVTDSGTSRGLGTNSTAYLSFALCI